MELYIVLFVFVVVAGIFLETSRAPCCVPDACVTSSQECRWGAAEKQQSWGPPTDTAKLSDTCTGCGDLIPWYFSMTLRVKEVWKTVSDCHDLILPLWFAVLLGIELVKKLLRTKPMLELGARLNDIPLPGCSSFPFDSKRYWECYIRHLTLTSYHPVGTCKMGPKSDTATVVNSNLMWVCNINF